MNNKTRSSNMHRIFILAACLALPACQTAPKDAQSPSSSAAKTNRGTANQEFKGIETARSATFVVDPKVNFQRELSGQDETDNGENVLLPLKTRH